MQIQGDIPPILDYRSFALKRAGSLGVFTSPPSIFEDPFTDKIGANASRWKSTVTGAAAMSVLTDTPGGICRLDSGATSGAGATASLGAGTDLPSVLPDITAGARWYLLWSFRITTAVDAQTACYLILAKAAGGGTNNIYFGADGQFASTTKFCVEDDVASAGLSSVNINTGWNYVEAWQTGTARAIKAAFNGEAPVSFTAGADIGGPATIRMLAFNGTTAASRKLDVDHLVVLMPGNVTLPNT